MGSMTRDQRRRMRERVYKARLQGYSIASIAMQCNLSEHTVSKLIKEARERTIQIRELAGDTDAIEDFVAEQDQIMTVGWARLKQMKDNKSLNVGNLLGIIGAASERKARALGVPLSQTHRLTGPDGRSNPSIEVDWTSALQRALSNPSKEYIEAEKVKELPKPVEDAVFYEKEAQPNE